VPYCTEEIKALGESYDAVRAAGADVVVITPQSQANARGYYADTHLPFPVLVDPDAEIAAEFGLAYTFPDYLKKLYLDVFSNDLAVVNAAHSWRLPIPGRFIIGTDGIIIDAQVDPDYRFRPTLKTPWPHSVACARSRRKRSHPHDVFNRSPPLQARERPGCSRSSKARCALDRS